jgi:hypothetical protein
MGAAKWQTSTYLQHCHTERPNVRPSRHRMVAHEKFGCSEATSIRDTLALCVCSTVHVFHHLRTAKLSEGALNGGRYTPLRGQSQRAVVVRLWQSGCTLLVGRRGGSLATSSAKHEALWQCPESKDEINNYFSSTALSHAQAPYGCSTDSVVHT